MTTPSTSCSPSATLEKNANPFVAQFPYLSPIFWLSNNNFSNYHALQVALTQHTWHGWSYVAGYTFSHALGESGDNWRFGTPVDQNNVRSLYGSTAFDVRHRFTIAMTYAIPGVNAPAQLLKGWSLNSVVTLMSSMPWGVNDTNTDFSGTGEGGSGLNQIPTANGVSGGEMWNFFGNPADFKTTMALVGTNCSGTPSACAGGIPYYTQANPGTGYDKCLTAANAMTGTVQGVSQASLAVASLTNLGCYVSLNGNSVLIPPAYGTTGNSGPFRFPGPSFYNVDFSVTKVTKFGERLSAQFRAEVFNILNHPNLANPFGGPGGVPGTNSDPTGSAGAGFGFVRNTPDVMAPNPVLGSGAARAIQLGLKLIF